jgi:hypothetical protein
LAEMGFDDHRPNLITTVIGPRPLPNPHHASLSVHVQVVGVEMPIRIVRSRRTAAFQNARDAQRSRRQSIPGDL